jgi:hypothetical protein
MEPDAKPPGAGNSKNRSVWRPILGNGLLVLLAALASYSNVEVTGLRAAGDSLGIYVLLLALGNFFALLFAVGRSKMAWATGFSISLFLLLLIGAGTCGQG